MLDEPPEWITFLLVAGGLALAVYNLGKLAQVMRLDKAMSWVARTLTAPIVESVNEHLNTVVALQVETQIDRVIYELRPNTGKSSHDAVIRRFDEVAEGVQALNERLSSHSQFSADDRAALHEHDLTADGQIREIRASLERLETGETPPDEG